MGIHSDAYWDITAGEFDHFAAIYDWIFTSEVFGHSTRPADALRSPCREAIARCKPRRILDCACGPGWQAIELRRQGYVVTGSDISRSMISLAHSHAQDAGLHIPFSVCGWHELPKKMRGKFDFLMCHGNAIGHCHGRAGMLESLEGMRAVSRDGASLYIDTRAWEWYRQNIAHYWPGASRDDAEGHHLVMFSGAVPARWTDAHVIETIHVLEADGQMHIQSFPMTFYAFKVGQLLACLRAAGFGHIETDYRAGCAGYYVLAQAV